VPPPDDPIERCLQAWPGVPREALRAHLEAAKGAGSHLDEVALAFAAAREDPGALAVLERGPLAAARLTIRRVDPGDRFADDVLQIVRVKLLLAHGERPPGLLGYSGKGPLRRWVEAIALSEAVKYRRRGPEAPAADETMEELLSSVDVELSVARKKDLAHFKAAFTSAWTALEPRDRNLLRLTVMDNVGVESLGRMHGVHASTAARWVIAARERLRAGAREALRQRLGLATFDMESLLRGLESSAPLSVSSVIRKG
jgi:RNA polymerase sigma-70 factor, ECF subfamily